MTFKNKLLTLLSLSLFVVVQLANAQTCESLFVDKTKILTEQQKAERLQIIRTKHILPVSLLIAEMKRNGSLIYEGKHNYLPGTEFLASNEFDWTKMPIDRNETDLIIGFGTNNVWDIAARKKAKKMVIADWSPWPIIAQEYIISPLIRIAKSPSDLILMLSGISPKQYSSLQIPIEVAFEMTEIFDRSYIYKVFEFLKELSENPEINETELKFLTTYFRAHIGDHLYTDRLGYPLGYGPFSNLRSPDFGRLNFFYNKRYNPLKIGQIDSVFSSLDNFNHLKKLFQNKNVYYGLTSITDLSFYDSIKNNSVFKNIKSLTLTVTNIFDCGCYNGLNFSDFQKLLKDVRKLFSNFKAGITVFRTTNNRPPHGFYKYEIIDENSIPLKDEYDSSAVKIENQAS